MLIYLLLLITWISLKYGFELNPANYSEFLRISFDVLPKWIFVFEIMLDLNTSYYSKGIYITDRAKIMKHYLKYHFPMDILTIFPLFFQGIHSLTILEIMPVLRVRNLTTLVKKLEECLQLKGKEEGIFQLIKLIINLLFLAHLCACVFHFLGNWELNNGYFDNWLSFKNIDGEVWQVRYVYSMYFSIVTMMTVGYGDISARNYVECIFIIFFIIYGCGVFGYSINNIGNIFKEMYQEDKDFK